MSNGENIIIITEKTLGKKSKSAYGERGRAGVEVNPRSSKAQHNVAEMGKTHIKISGILRRTLFDFS